MRPTVIKVTHIVQLPRHCVDWNRLPQKSIVPYLRTLRWIQTSQVTFSTHQRSLIVSTSNIYLSDHSHRNAQELLDTTPYYKRSKQLTDDGR